MDKLLFKIFDGGNASDRDFKLNTGFLNLLLRVIDDITGEDRAVRQEDNVIIFIEQCRLGNIDIDDFTAVVTNLDKIIDRYFFTETDDNPTDNISKKVLGYNGNGGCYNGEGCKHMAKADSKEPEYGNKSIDSDKHDKQIAESGGDIVPFMVW